ncbi:unnamed protein product [Heligmosomoides polygyrus]|uniref:Uncharacterized protein n=1 Tax=Heligmosomoides polygyrus TaxID=6339 RepID=A0A183FNC3_HELPZ|nr:unnamed protein product [Heligmosomoides polygyrus]
MSRSFETTTAVQAGWTEFRQRSRRKQSASSQGGSGAPPQPEAREVRRRRERAPLNAARGQQCSTRGGERAYLFKSIVEPFRYRAPTHVTCAALGCSHHPPRRLPSQHEGRPAQKQIRSLQF